MLAPSAMTETKIIYHIDDEETPYLVKISKPPEEVTLLDFKNVLNRPNFKFFFKSMDDDFGIVKEEVADENCHLPCINGRVVSWLVSSEGSVVDGGASQCGDVAAATPLSTVTDTVTDTDSVPHRVGGAKYGSQLMSRHRGVSGRHRHDLLGPDDSVNSSLLSSELETTSFFDSDEDDGCSSHITTTTGDTSVSRVHRRHRHHQLKQKQRRRRRRGGGGDGGYRGVISRTPSYTSLSDSTLTMNIISVTLNMECVSYLGVSIVGQSNRGTDDGIYVGSIMKGGAVALDGRIQPGDMILQVNDINFENMTNDEAVNALRRVVQKPGPVTLVVAKCWGDGGTSGGGGGGGGYFTLPRTEPVRPIDPGAWVAHTAACREFSVGDPSVYESCHEPLSMRQPSLTTLTSTNSSIVSSVIENPKVCSAPLTVQSGMLAVTRAMAAVGSGLEVRDRMWLKITIPCAFIGSDVVDWLYSHVSGFSDRREARKYTCHLLRAGFIKHTVNKNGFSEQCYYVFGDLSAGGASGPAGDNATVLTRNGCVVGDDPYSSSLSPPLTTSAPDLVTEEHRPPSSSFFGSVTNVDLGGNSGSSAAGSRHRLFRQQTDNSDLQQPESASATGLMPPPPPPPPSSHEYFVNVM